MLMRFIVNSLGYLAFVFKLLMKLDVFICLEILGGKPVHVFGKVLIMLLVYFN